MKKIKKDKMIKRKLYNLFFIATVMIGILVIFYKEFYNIVGGNLFEIIKLPNIADTSIGYIVIITILIVETCLKIKEEKETNVYALLLAIWTLVLIESATHII